MKLAEIRERRKTWVQKDKYSGESTLVVLPCNDGGPIGNYFKGGKGNNLWRRVDYYLREWRDDVVLSAVDNAVAWMPGRDDGLGALEFEFEMSRCISPWDAGIPTANRFDARKIQMFVDSLRITCQRIKMYGFTQVYVILTPLAYRTSFAQAAQLEGLSFILFSAARCGVAGVAAKLLRVCYDQHSMTRGVLVTHQGMAKVPLPKVPEKWGLEDPVERLGKIDASALVPSIQGKYGKYYVDLAQLQLLRSGGVSEKDFSDMFLVPEEEDFQIFRERSEG